MNQVLSSNIFFFITSISVVLITIVVLLLLYYIYRTVKNIKELSDTMKMGTEELIRNVRDDGGVLRRGVRRYGGKIAKAVLFAALSNMKDKFDEKKSKKKKDK